MRLGGGRMGERRRRALRPFPEKYMPSALHLIELFYLKLSQGVMQDTHPEYGLRLLHSYLSVR